MKISCPGKIILIGEHGVVYGKPAIVAAIDKRMKLEIKKTKNDSWQIKANSELPPGIGLGYSAAQAVVFSATLVTMFQNTVTKEKALLSLINGMAYEQEKINHGHPSGVDNTVCTYGGILWYQKIKDKPVFKKLRINHLPEFVLINTGKPVETTKEMVELAGSKFKSQNLFNEIEEQTKLFLEALFMSSLRAERSNLIKNSIKTCERCLEELGVVGELAKKVVREIESFGGAAKISGAGGLKQGSGILLCYHQDMPQIFAIAKKFKIEAFKIKLGAEGVKIEC